MNVGDVVELNSGGPKMTVEAILDDVRIKCCWFDSGEEIRHAEFKKPILKKFEEE